MAAPSPRKPRRVAKGRHRKPSTFDASNCAHWLGVGAVGVGLVAALAGGQGTAWAAPDGSSGSGDANDSAAPRGAQSGSGMHRPAKPNASKQSPSKRSTRPVHSTGDGAATAVPISPVRKAVAEKISAPTSFAAAVDGALNRMGLDIPGRIPAPTIPWGDFVEALSLAIRHAHYRQSTPRGVSIAAALPLPTPAEALNLVNHLAESGAAALREAGAHVSDEIGDVTDGLIGMIRGAGGENAVPAAQATAAAVETPAQTAIATLQQVLYQLVGWPEPPSTVFVTPANYPLDQALDAHDLTIDLLVANPIASTRWIPDLLGILGMFFKPAIPGYTFSDTLNVWGSLLNRIVPPYKMSDSIGGTITKTQVAAAAVGAMVKVLDQLLAGEFDPQQLENAAIAGGTSGFLDPSSILNMTFSTGAAPNLFSLMAYTVVVALYDRFKWVALDHLPVVTSVTQSGQLLLTVAGKVNATDADGDPLTYSAGQAANGIVTMGADGSWLYTRTSDWSTTGTDTFTVTIDDSLGVFNNSALDHPYAPNGHTTTVTVTVNYTGTANTAPTALAFPGLPDGMGVVRGNVTGLDFDADTLTYSLVNPGTTGATNKSITTSEGGIVQLDTTTGTFVYIPKVSTDFLPGLDTDSFKVQVSDGHGGTSNATVVVLSNLKVDTSTTSTSAYTESGKVNIPSADAGLLTYSLGTGPSKGTVTVNADGTYTYHRNAALPTTVSTEDTFTIIGTDVNGKTVTLPAVSVSPPLVTITPTTTVSGGTFTPRGMVNGSAWTPATQTTTGTFSGVDLAGHAVTISGGIYSTARGGLVTVTSGGGFLYTYTTYSDAFHQAGATTASAADKADTVQINVTDSAGKTTAVTFSIALRTENNTPSSSNSVGAADGLGVVRGSVSGSDNDGDSFSYSLVGASGSSMYTSHGGIVTLDSNGTFTYVPTKSASTSDTFQVTVNDGHGGTSTTTVTVPQTTPSPVTNINTATNNVVTGKLNIPTGDTVLGLTYSPGTDGTKGHVTVNADGSFTYTRNTGLGHTTSPNDSFTVKATDSTGKSVIIATVNVTPTVANSVPVGGPVTGTPVLNDTDLGINRQQTTTGTLGVSDPDGDTVTFTAGTYDTTLGGKVTVNANGTFSYTSAKKLKGTQDLYWHNAAVPGAPGDTFTIAVSDGFGGTTNLVYSIPVATLNTAPSSTVTTSISGTDGLGVVRGTVTGSDSDSYYNYVTLSLTPVTDTLSYSLSGAGNTASTSTSATTAGGGIVQLSGNSFTYIPTAGVTSDSFKVLVSDGHGGTSVATVNLTALTTPSPVTNINTATTNVVTGKLNVPAGDTGLGLTYGVGADGSKGHVTVNADGTFAYTRTAGLGHTTTPNDSFTIKATDANGRTVTIATLSVIPTVANNAPTVTVASPAAVGTRTGTTQSTSGKISWGDADGDALTINGQTAPVGTGTITLTSRNGGTVVLKGDGTYTYTRTVSNAQSHAAAMVGAADNAVNDYIDVTVADAYGGSTTLPVKVPVFASNTAPGTTSGGIRWGSYWTGVGNASDSDGDDVSYVVTSTQGTASYDDFWLTLSTSGAGSGTVVTITVYDGYYVVSGGAVTSALSSNSRTYTTA